ncbi:MAG TPA: glutamine amidotransferase [Actinomycetota bacterium]|nr:glutamine amidotransferase [Actinomycetota bacterium]
MSAGSAIRIGLIYPELMGTYGDRGNAAVLARRLEWRAMPGELVVVPAGDPIPLSLDCYVLGGAEDIPQTLAADGLIAAAPGLSGTLDAGAVLLANCAGFQLLGSSYVRTDGKAVPGMGLIDAATVAGPRRTIGEIVVDMGDPRVPPLSGFENHAGLTRLGPEARPLGKVLAGTGNGDGWDGAIVEGRIVATYLHGPVLARNPALADLLLAWVAGELPPIESGDTDALAARLRQERRAAAGKPLTGRGLRWLHR